ncbi:hypothetical protein CEXT_193201 [Caerostris extrusa]|uniref:Uncharacterized protein n=1 Tax=Caerostris extrusa TaxID=172846 RepID=A0AAV4UWN1_CAEEX|nr:hypothetical protein CEXT_193201 [Caerostris extrusa]
MKLAQIVFQLHWCPTFQQVEYTDRSSTDTEVRGFGGDEFDNVMHNCGSSVIEKIEAHIGSCSPISWNTKQFPNRKTVISARVCWLYKQRRRGTHSHLLGIMVYLTEVSSIVPQRLMELFTEKNETLHAYEGG